MIRFTGYGVIAEKPRIGQAKFFRARCMENYKLDQKMNDTFYDGHDKLYHHAKFGEDRTMRAGCRCENVVFVFCLFVCHASSPEQRAFEGCIVRTSIAAPFIVRFRRGLQLFSQEIALSDTLHSSHIRR